MLELKRFIIFFSFLHFTSPNRTMLELKLINFFTCMNIASTSQSHHAGIETYFHVDYFKSLNCSQSHHAGIETAWVSGNAQVWGDSQSHHAGIETAYAHKADTRTYAPNRTMLELKQGGKHGDFITVKSPNRTMLELKLMLHIDIETYSSSQSHHAGIETFSRSRQEVRLLRLPIAPCWN